MIKYFQNLFAVWSDSFSQKSFLFKFIPTIIAYLIFFKLFRVAAEEMEHRIGTQWNDWLLQLLPPTDFSVITFILTYFALGFFLVTILPHPKRFVVGLQAYTMLLIFRMITIYLVPLEPPVGMILLKDPMSNFFMKSTSETGYIVKDLFFSGHISAIFLFFLVSIHKVYKGILLTVAFVVATFILFQHVHYTVDILAAPLFSLFAYRLAKSLNKEEVASVAIPKLK